MAKDEENIAEFETAQRSQGTGNVLYLSLSQATSRSISETVLAMEISYSLLSLDFQTPKRNGLECAGEALLNA